MAILPEQSDMVFGIDLGTTNSAISLMHRGQAVVLKLKGQKSLPSVVYISKGEARIGRDARQRAMMYPNNTVASAKRYMGSAHDWEIDGTRYSPTDIATLLLTHMVDGVAQETQEVELGGRPYNVIITVPANFNDLQKQATRTAAEQAGLNVLDLIEEPIAAALAYAAKQAGVRNILVYDLGGGTFDVSILEVATQKTGEMRIDLRVLAKDGVPDVGGDDFDIELMKLAAGQLQADTGIEIFNEARDQGFSVSKQREALQKLKLKCETLKHELSDASSASLSIPDLIMDESGVSQSIQMEISRDTFEAAIADLIGETQQAVERALRAANKELDEIDRIILVGGSTRVPAVRACLVEMFGKEPYGNIDPDTAVAMGAAMYGESMQRVGQSGHEGSVVIINSVSHHLGVLLHGDRFDWLLARGQEIPFEGFAEVERDSYTNPFANMRQVSVQVYQSMAETPPSSPDSEAKRVGEFFVAIPQVAAGEANVAVRFKIGNSNMLTVTARSAIDSKELSVKRS